MMPIILVVIVVYRIFTHPHKIQILINDFKDPQFISILVLVFLFLFFVKDPNTKKEKITNDHAIVAGISAYFGHLDLPLTACFLAGFYSYYTYRPPDQLLD